MPDGDTSHITVTCYGNYPDRTVYTYAVTAEVARELEKVNRKRNWFYRHTKDLTGKGLKDWLDSKGCKLDNPNGPAYDRFSSFDDYGDMTAYYRDGKLHRVGGPACITFWSKEYYLDGIQQPDPSADSGLTAQRPAPKTPDGPGAAAGPA